jgi:hypothetical protein
MFGQVKNQQTKCLQMHSPTYRWAMLLLCLAVLMVQTLGHVHRTVHWPTHGFGAIALGLQASTILDESLSSPGVAAPHSHQGMLGLFKHHQDLPKCQLFDGVGTAQALASVIAVTPISAPGLTLSTFHNVFVAERLSRHFQARAPPHYA